MIKINELYDLTHTQAAAYLEGFTYPWEALSGIKDLIYKIGETLSEDEYDHPKDGVWIHKTAEVFPSAYLLRFSLACHRTAESHGLP